MTDPSTVLTDVRRRRAEAGLTQSELAGLVGVSRQALSAIESGRQIPSTTLALRLARALGCAVDDLFRLTSGSVVPARLATDPGALGRVVVGRVDDVLVAHPLADESASADGVLVGGGRVGSDTRVELFGDRARLEDVVLVAGCAPLLGVLADRMGRRYRDADAAWIPAHSAGALELLEGGLVHVAGIHLADAGDPSVHVEAARTALPGSRAALVNLARWRQGLVVARGNPLGITTGPDLTRPELRWAVRDAGAAAQRLLLRAWRAAGGESSPTGTAVASDHSDVARLVRWGVVDVGVAIESAALAAGLDFIPLSEERFDLLVHEGRLREPAVERFLGLIDRPSFRNEVSRLPGYDLGIAGHVATVAAS